MRQRGVCWSRLKKSMCRRPRYGRSPSRRAWAKIDADPAELAAAIEPSGFLQLPVSAAHAAAVAQLELHHTDPFDRLLIAQALAEPLKLVTADALLAMYSELVVVV